MKKIMTLLAFFCWQNLYSQEKSWSVQATTFSASDYGYVIEPEVTFALDNEFSFHEFSLNSSGSLCAINGIITESWSPYVYLSCNPKTMSSYSSIGVSKSVSFGSEFGAIAYAEVGITDAEFKNWSLGVGMIYSLDIPSINFKKRRR